LESLVTKHDSRECECALCLSTHHLAIPTAFLPGPPNLRPTRSRSIARTSARRLDTLPLCLGSDCLLVKERRRPHALENRDCNSGLGVVNTKPPHIFTFFGPRGMNRVRDPGWDCHPTPVSSIVYHAARPRQARFLLFHTTPASRPALPRNQLLSDPRTPPLSQFRPPPSEPAALLEPAAEQDFAPLL